MQKRTELIRASHRRATRLERRPVVDGADYLTLVKAAMLRAERRIMLIGWDLDHRTTFEPGGAT
ncbi:hypothetical protein C6A85_10085, partial [Mycobacterium sp. ITM-2017-0098]